MNRKTALTLSLMGLSIAAVIAGGWAAIDFNSRWCGSQTAWFRMVRVLTVDLWVLFAGGLGCFAGSVYSHRVLRGRPSALLLAAIPFFTAIAFLGAGWLVRHAIGTGLFSGVGVSCVTDSRSFFQHIADSLSNLWRNNRGLLIGDAIVAAALIAQIAWITVASPKSNNPRERTD